MRRCVFRSENFYARFIAMASDNFASDFLFPLKMAAPGRRDGDVINTPFVRVQFGARYLYSLPVTRPHSEEGKRVYAMLRQIHPAISKSMVTILSRPLASYRLPRVLSYVFAIKSIIFVLNNYYFI